MKHARRRSDGPTVGSPSVHLQRRTTVVSVIPQSPLADTSTTGRSPPTGCVAFRRNGRGLRFFFCRRRVWPVVKSRGPDPVVAMHQIVGSSQNDSAAAR